MIENAENPFGHLTGDQLKAGLLDHWSELLDYEESCFQRCVELDRISPEKTKPKSEAVREWWGVTNAILWLFIRTRAQFDFELNPFPAYTLGRLANIAEELARGNVPEFVLDVGKGGRPLWRKERHHIAYGVLYIEAARRGEIADRHPNKTVRQAYNVTAQAVQGWMQRRDEICVGVPHEHLSPEKLRKKMLECGAIYSRIGRGAPSHN